MVEEKEEEEEEARETVGKLEDLGESVELEEGEVVNTGKENVMGTKVGVDIGFDGG